MNRQMNQILVEMRETLERDAIVEGKGLDDVNKSMKSQMGSMMPSYLRSKKVTPRAVLNASWGALLCAMNITFVMGAKSVSSGLQKAADSAGAAVYGVASKGDFPKGHDPAYLKYLLGRLTTVTKQMAKGAKSIEQAAGYLADLLTTVSGLINTVKGQGAESKAVMQLAAKMGSLSK